MFLAFHGKPSVESNDTLLEKAHESRPKVMTGPADAILALGSLLVRSALFYDLFIGDDWQEFWREAFSTSRRRQPGPCRDLHHVPTCGEIVGPDGHDGDQVWLIAYAMFYLALAARFLIFSR